MSKIRKAEQEDVEGIFDLIVELENASFDYQAFKDIYFDNLCNPHIHYLLCMDNQNVIGFISLHIQFLLHHVAKIAEIQEFIVRKDMRGRGIGVELFNAAVETAKQNGCLQIEVCCNQKRKSSHIFYEKRGMSNNHSKFSKML